MNPIIYEIEHINIFFYFKIIVNNFKSIWIKKKYILSEFT